MVCCVSLSRASVGGSLCVSRPPDQGLHRGPRLVTSGPGQASVGCFLWFSKISKHTVCQRSYCWWQFSKPSVYRLMPDHSYYLPDPRGRSDLPPRVTEWPLRDFPALTFLQLCLRLHNVHAGGARTNSHTRARSIAPRRILRAVSATREVPSSPSPVNTPAPEVTAVWTKTLFTRARHSLARGSHSVRPASLSVLRNDAST